MSFKAKDLQYDANEPAFLRRLRNGISSNTDDPDRRTNAAAGRGFARKARKDDDDDGPTYVMEGSETTLSKDEAEKLLKSPDGDDEQTAEASIPATGDAQTRNETSEKASVEDAEKPVQQVATSGITSKKRKAIKVLDTDDEATEGKHAIKPSKPKTKKKAKAIKLNFDDDDEA